MNTWTLLSAGLQHLCRPAHRVFGQTFHRSIRNGDALFGRHYTRPTQPCRVPELRYGRDQLLALQFTGRRDTCACVFDCIMRCGLLVYMSVRAGRRVRVYPMG